MRSDRTQSLPFLILAILTWLTTMTTPVVASGQPVAEGKGTIHERVAGMSDEEARKQLIAALEKQVPESGAPAGKPAPLLGKLIDILGRESETTHHRLLEIADNIPENLSDLYRVLLSVSPTGSPAGAFRIIFGVLFFIGIGLIADKAVNIVLRRKYYRNHSSSSVPLAADDNLPIGERLVSGVSVVLPSILGLVVFFLAAYLSYFTFIWTDSSSARLLLLAVLLTITVVRTIAILTEIALSPGHRQFRLIPLDSKMAGIVYRLIVWAWGYIISVLMFSLVIQRFGARSETVITVNLFAATFLLAATAAMVILYRKPVSAYLLVPTVENTRPQHNLAAVWHFLALLYLIILWGLMMVSVVDPGVRTKGAFLLSFFALPIWLLIDRVAQWLVKHIMISLRLCEAPPDSQPAVETASGGEPPEGHELFLKVNRYARLVVVLAIILWLASLWGYTVPFVSSLSKALFQSLIVSALALFAWKFISSWIERKIHEKLPEGEANHDDVDDEWGSNIPRGRSYTLLPIIRSFIASILIIMVTLTVLSSLGVNIGPLLAGAGVVGLAVGFGAQKIVSDIFSGIFYLLDDAFRVGEYIMTGDIMGTVEKISLRNVMLRHHRGMLQIVPYSQLGTITNYMRGGIVEKFNLDFGYDADIDKIRKIIKKVGQEMLEDPELGEGFIRPLKSQGVREISNSVMTIRVKFTAKPGTQFTIRREAYKRITAALQAKGIQYAHKKVIVDLPVPLTGHEDDAQVQKIVQSAGAAAREIIDEEERQKQLARQK